MLGKQMKISGSSLQTSTNLGAQTPFVTLGRPPHPMAVLLFGRRPPRRLDPRRYPKLKRALRKLRFISGEVAELLGLDEDDFPLSLCEGENAAISREGELFIGIDLLREHEHDSDLLLGVLGHEIGHQPWTWPNMNLRGLTTKQRGKLHREEEAKADRFAGRALADLGGNPESICKFLLENAGFEARRSTDYYPPETRVKMILETYSRRKRALRVGAAILGVSAPRTRELR
jgi:hypothetical protein